jgi:hypothetical protein
MKKSFFIAILLLNSLSGFSQLVLNPIIYCKDRQDSIKEKFLLDNPQIELPQDWITVNVNYLTFTNLKKVSPFAEKKFIKNLIPSGKYYIIHQVIDTLKNRNCYSLTSSNTSSFGITIRPTGKDFVSKIKYLSKVISLDKGIVFFVPPLDEMFLIYENNIYVVGLERLFEFNKYMKTNYKNRIEFQNQFKVNMN